MSASNHSSNLHQSAASTALTAWGISSATARQFCLHYDGRNAFSYPSAEGYRSRLLFIQRPNNGAKNIWDKRTAHLPMPALYNAAGLSSGSVYLTNGEKSTLALYTAGITNAVNTFGEGNRIKDAIQVLLEKNIQRVWFAPDCDTPGLRAARRWYELGSAAGLDIQLFDLRLYLASEYQFTPEQYAKWDLRDLWLLVKQDPTAFQTALDTMPSLDFGRYAEEITPKASTPITPVHKKLRVNSLDIDWTAAHQNWVAEEVMPALDRVSPPPSRGKHRPCPNPYHHDNNPSFRISEQGIPQCTCGIQTEQKPWQQVAGWVGALPWADYKAALVAEKCKERAATAPKTKKKKLSLADIISQLEPCLPSPFSADETLDLRYISGYPLTQRTLFIKSPIGTGKTEALKELVKQHRRSLVIVHRQSLARSMAERLGLPCYSDLTSQELVNVNRVVICLNSLPKIVGKLNLQSYDLIAIDEFTQVLEHLDGNTFTGREALDSYKILGSLLTRAKQVVALDAGMNDLAGAWLAALRGDKWNIENIYCVPRGKIKLYYKADALIETALQTVQSGNIAIACGLERSESLRLLFAKEVGEDNVRVVNRKNSLSDDTQNFLANINLSPLPRVLIYTPSLGSGFDITQPVSAVFGLFEGTWFTAPDLHQMLGRCRNRQETHVYLPQLANGTRLEDAQLIFDLDAQAATLTSHEGKFDEHGVFVTSETQRELSRLLATLQAERNRSQNNLLAHFIALVYVEGYTLEIIEGSSQSAREQMDEARDEYRLEDKERVLAATPIDDVELDAYRAQGDITPEIWAGNDRYHIEKTVGTNITPSIYDDLYTKFKRDALKVFTDLRRTPENLQAHDRDEAISETLLSHRQHHAPRARLMQTLLQTVFEVQSVDDLRKGSQPLVTKDISERMRAWMDEHIDDIPRYFERRKERSAKPLALLRWMLARVGLSLERQRIREGGKLTYVYWIAGELAAVWFAYSDTRLASLNEPICSHSDTLDIQANCRNGNKPFDDTRPLPKIPSDEDDPDPPPTT